MGEFDTDEFVPIVRCAHCNDLGHRADECLGDLPCPCGRSHTTAEHNYNPDKEDD